MTSFRTRQAETGFTLAELIILIAVIGILSVMAVPAFLRYYQAATLKSGAQQFVDRAEAQGAFAEPETEEAVRAAAPPI